LKSEAKAFGLNVLDVAAPSIRSAVPSRAVLWPPNHRMVQVDVAYDVTDNCTPTPACGLDVTSNEPVNGTDDGDTAPDWTVVDAHRVQLRAERSGVGTGRVYTIGISCVDASGNASRSTVSVKVPLSQP
jgi:hypothetical protein